MFPCYHSKTRLNQSELDFKNQDNPKENVEWSQ